VVVKTALRQEWVEVAKSLDPCPATLWARQNCRGLGHLRDLVKHPTLDLSPGLDLGVMRSSPVLGSMLGVVPT